MPYHALHTHVAPCEYIAIHSSYRIVYSVPDGRHHTLTAVLVTDSKVV